MNERAHRRSARALLVVLWAGLCALHVAAVFTENINWDEFALFQRVANMLRTGRLQGGGRPGAVELILAPFVHRCDDAVAAIRQARLLWVAAVIASLVALYRAMLLLRKDRAHPASGAILAVSLFALALPFLRWSVQVRTDQISLAFGLWAGVALLASRTRSALALLAGAAFGLGFLCTQKVAYLAILWLTLCAAEPYVQGVSQPRSEASALAWRALLCAAGFGLVFALYRLALPLVLVPAKSYSFESGLRTMDMYRHTFGPALYRGMLSGLKPHALLVGLLVVATFRAVWLRLPLRHLGMTWLLLALGTAVALFHAGTFPYFWLTLGVFPSVALAYCSDELFGAIPPRLHRFALVGFGAALVLPAIVYSSFLLRDSQQPQRAALRFIDREFATTARGFQLEGALFCRSDDDPFPVLFRVHIDNMFTGAHAEQAIATFLAQFQTKPVSFLIVSHMIPYFPDPIHTFWADNYQPYFGSVRIAGRRLQGPPYSEQRFPLFIPGKYRWLSDKPARASEVNIDGVRVKHEATIELGSGEHSATFSSLAEGRLVLAVAQRPVVSTAPFYTPGAIREIVGGNYWPP